MVLGTDRLMVLRISATAIGIDQILLRSSPDPPETRFPPGSTRACLIFTRVVLKISTRTMAENKFLPCALIACHGFVFLHSVLTTVQLIEVR